MSKDFKKDYRYIMKNEVNITIYDRFRELIKEFGEEDYNYDYVSRRPDDEKKHYIENISNIESEITTFEYIEDEIQDLMSHLRNRKEKLHRVKRYVKNHFILNGEIYNKSINTDSIWFSTDDKKRTVGAFPRIGDLETKEMLYQIDLIQKREGDSIFDGSITLPGYFTYDQVDKVIKHFVINKKMDVDNESVKTSESRRDLKIKILLEI